jgi:hypothetical protein
MFFVSSSFRIILLKVWKFYVVNAFFAVLQVCSMRPAGGLHHGSSLRRQRLELEKRFGFVGRGLACFGGWGGVGAAR